MDVVVIGGGLTGLSTGYHLKKDYVILESLPYSGGLAGSYIKEGFTFDHGGVHILRTYDNYLRGRHKAYYNVFQKKLLAGNLNKKDKRGYIYLEGNLHNRPFQHNLYGASQQIIDECNAGIEKLKRKIVFADDEEKKARNFASFKDEMLNVFGEGLCKYFMFPYNEKAWCHDLSTMRSKMWISKNFGTIFDVSKYEEGVKFPNDVDKSIAKYPKKGGFGATGQAIHNLVKDNIRLNSKVTHVNPDTKEIIINGIEKISYNHLVSTIPLPILISIMTNVPEDVKQAAQSLKYTSMLCVNIGVNRASISDAQFIYYPEREICFARVSFPVNQSSHAAPEGKTGICVEVPHSIYKPLNKETIVIQVMKDLVKVGVLKEDDEILFRDVRDVRYSYVVQDLELDKNMKTIQEFLRTKNINSIGRYGEWKHSGTEHAVQDGKQIAEKLRFDR